MNKNPSQKKLGALEMMLLNLSVCVTIAKSVKDLAQSHKGSKGLRHNKRMTIDQLKAFLSNLQKNQELLNAIRVAATANEIAEIAWEFGYQFSGDELKAASKENIAGVKIKKQDTSPSYSFGESGIDPNEENYKSAN